MNNGPPNGFPSQYLLILYMYVVCLVVSDRPFCTGDVLAAAEWQLEFTEIYTGDKMMGGEKGSEEAKFKTEIQPLS